MSHRRPDPVVRFSSTFSSTATRVCCKCDAKSELAYADLRARDTSRAARGADGVQRWGLEVMACMGNGFDRPKLVRSFPG